MFVYILYFEDMIISSDRSDSGDSGEVTLCRAVFGVGDLTCDRDRLAISVFTCLLLA